MTNPAKPAEWLGELAVKLSAVYALPSEGRFGYVLRGGLAEMLEAMSELGYEGVEYSIANPFEADLKALLRATEEYGLRVSAVSTGLAYLEYGISLTHPSPTIRDRALRFMGKYVEFASSHEAGVIIGLIRGKRKGRTVERTMNLLTNSLRRLKPICHENSVSLLLEPINRYETDYINRVSEALNLIEQLDGYVKILLDTFHMSIEERNLYDAILEAGPAIGYVHIAENNRLPPGLGSIDWERVTYRLLRAGYRGYLSLEALPKPTPIEALRLTADKIKPLISWIRI